MLLNSVVPKIPLTAITISNIFIVASPLKSAAHTKFGLDTSSM